MRGEENGNIRAWHTLDLLRDRRTLPPSLAFLRSFIRRLSMENWSRTNVLRLSFRGLFRQQRSNQPFR